MIDGRDDPRVAIASVQPAEYGHDAADKAWEGLTRAAEMLGLQTDDRGPLGKVISPGSRVLIKPNLVVQPSCSPHGVQALLTNPAIIDAAFRAACYAKASDIVIGDSPIQSCDFAAMLSASGLETWSRTAKSIFPGFRGVQDFRAFPSPRCLLDSQRDYRVVGNFTIFDLGEESMLEPITGKNSSFRVTCYDPRVMQRAHSVGRHQYAIANEVLNADVVINSPKLKMHKRAGVTCALKNLVGVNARKDYLPHHRLGGASEGGDCYPGKSLLKASLEFVLDHQNRATASPTGKVWGALNIGITKLLRFAGDWVGTDGSWCGNDTVWRMCLDLNRILIYGTTDGKLANTPQRLIINFVDAVVAGQGNGPLEPTPLPLGLLLLGQNAAAVDWVGAHLLGYNADRIPLVRNAFDIQPYPIANFSNGDVEIVGDLGHTKANCAFEYWIPTVPKLYPRGWIQAAARFEVSTTNHDYANQAH